LRFDEMNVFQRPKKSEMIGGLRKKIYDVVERPLVVEEAKERGYFEDPTIIEAVESRREQMMLTKMHAEVVKYDEYVGPEDLDAFWVERKQDYFVSEGREGRIVYCEDESLANQARTAAQGDTPWGEILTQFGTDQRNIDQEGKVGPIHARQSGSVKEALFSLAEVSGVSEPFAEGEKWAVVRLEKIVPPYQKELAEVREQVGQRIKLRRKDEALRKLLAEWRSEFEVIIYEENLEKVRPWEELTSETTETLS
jgi:hypothetical protein